MVPGYRRRLGDRGEAIAASYLRRQEYKLLEHQYRYRRGDVDLICYDPADDRSEKGSLVFVEVKTRTNYRFGRPEEAVTIEKQRRIIRVARGYLRERGLQGAPCRFDVVAVTIAPDNDPLIKHIKDAFWAE